MRYCVGPQYCSQCREEQRREVAARAEQRRGWRARLARRLWDTLAWLSKGFGQ